jgi:hypothetical protein
LKEKKKQLDDFTDYVCNMKSEKDKKILQDMNFPKEYKENIETITKNEGEYENFRRSFVTNYLSKKYELPMKYVENILIWLKNYRSYLNFKSCPKLTYLAETIDSDDVDQIKNIIFDYLNTNRIKYVRYLIALLILSRP